MKKILLSLIPILISVCMSIGAFSQCPNPNDTVVGFRPPADSLDCIVQGLFFNQTVQLNIPATFDTNVPPLGQMTITIDSIRGDSVIGLPSGISADCFPPSCVIPGGLAGCMTFSGITNDTPGIYPLTIMVTATITIPILGTQVQQIDLASIGPTYYLNVIAQGTVCTNSYSGVKVNPRVISGSPCGGGTITLDAGISGGSGIYQVDWTGSIPVDSPGSVITTATIPPTGSYTFTVQVIDSIEGDTSVADIDINSSFSPFAVDAGSDASIGCTGGSIALLHASVTTANGAGSTFRWSNGTTGEFISAVPGTYTVTATDAGGCLQDVDDVTVYGNINITLNGIHENCGAGNGLVSSAVTGGAGGFAYQWSNGGSGFSISNLSAGTYVLTITDASGCDVADSISILDSCGIISGIVFDDINANGVKDGNEPAMAGVEVTASGTTARTNSQGIYELIIPAFGNYTVTVDTPYRYYCFNSLYLPDVITTPLSGTYSISISSGNSVSIGNDFGLDKPATTCGNISGRVFQDLNSNGMDDGEPGHPNFQMQISPVGFTFSNPVGMYMSDVPFDTPLTISGPVSISSYYCYGGNSLSQTFPPFNGGYNVTVTQGSPISSGNDFGYTAGASFDAGVFNVGIGDIIPCQNFNVWMDWKRFGTATTDCYLILEYPADANFISSYPPVDTIGTTFIGWHFPVGTPEEFGCYQMTFYMECGKIQGTPLTFTGRWDCDSLDGCPGNDSLTRTAIIGSSFRRSNPAEANYMVVYHQNDEEKYTIDYVDSSFSYLIWFRNMSSDTAYNMTIIDTLPPHFQLNTISNPFSNKAFDFKVKNDNILIWEFRNINLPPAKDDLLNSYGFTQFNVIMKPNLPQGTLFENRAAVVFNYSEPVLTNKAENILGTPPVGVEQPLINDAAIFIYPNPNDGKFRVEGTSPVDTDWQLQLLSVEGKLVYSESFSRKREIARDIDAGSLSKGVYLLKVETTSGVSVRKVVVH